MREALAKRKKKFANSNHIIFPDFVICILFFKAGGTHLSYDYIRKYNKKCFYDAISF